MKEFYNVHLTDNDFSVYDNGNGWIWEHRCTNSEDDYDLTFDSAIDALCHFISITLEAEDKQMQE